MFEKVTEFIEEIRKTGIPSADCIIYHGGKQVYRYMSGYADEAKTKPISGNETYNLYSCSKPVTVAAALLLYERGLLDLDAPLYEHLPEYRAMNVKTEKGIEAAKEHIKIRHLFQMTAGFDYDLGSEAVKKTRAEDPACPTRLFVKNLAELPLNFEPGDRWNYSLCHDVLAAVVEVISGKRYGEFVRENIFEPLGMKDSTFHFPEADLSRMADEYRYNTESKAYENMGKACPYRFGDEYESGGAGMIGTVEDYMRFLEGMRKYEVLKPETVRLMTGDVVDKYAERTCWDFIKTHHYGLGVRCPRAEAGTTEYGWGGAAGAYLSIDEANELTVFYAQHVLSSPAQSIRSNLYDMALECLK